MPWQASSGGRSGGRSAHWFRAITKARELAANLEGCARRAYVAELEELLEAHAEEGRALSSARATSSTHFTKDHIASSRCNLVPKACSTLLENVHDPRDSRVWLNRRQAARVDGTSRCSRGVAYLGD